MENVLYTIDQIQIIKGTNSSETGTFKLLISAESTQSYDVVKSSNFIYWTSSKFRPIKNYKKKITAYQRALKY